MEKKVPNVLFFLSLLMAFVFNPDKPMDFLREYNCNS